MRSVFLVASALLLAGTASARWRPPDDAAVAGRLMEAKKQRSLAERIVVVSDPFVGAPYQLSPLGEGEGPDPDPRLRFDAFDCTTFVETTLALSLARDLDEARALLDLIRYREGRPEFLGRRHFPAAEWLPELREMGFLEDITREVGGDEVVVEKKVLNPEVWERRRRPSHLELPKERIPDGVFSLEVWPLDAARRGQGRIPPGTLLNLVRVDFKSVPVRVSHQGIVIEKNGKRYLRHAADRMYHSVVDEPLDRFFARMQKYKRWPVAGVHLVRITEPQGWRELLRRPVASEGATEAPSAGQ